MCNFGINARLATWNDLVLAVVIALIPQAIIRTLRQSVVNKEIGMKLYWIYYEYIYMYCTLLECMQ